MEPTERQKKLLKWVGYPLLGLVTLLLTISYTFPYERLENRLVAELEKKFNVSIGSVGPTLLPGGIVVENLMLETRPEESDEEPAVLVVDRVKARVGLFRLLTGSVGVKADARIGEGRLVAQASYGGRGLAVSVRSEELPLDRLPVKSAVGLPMTGGLELDAELVLPEMRFGEARGFLELACSSCTIGDGETKIKPKARPGRARGNLFAQGGLTVPRIDLGTMRGSITIEDGRGEVEELSAVSPDGELHVTGELELTDPFMQSQFPGCIRFRLTEDFAEREPGFGNTRLWMPQRSLQDDGFYALPTEGAFRNFRWNPRRTCDGMPTQERDAPRRGRSRPSVTISPDDDSGGDEREPPSISPRDDEDEDEQDADVDEEGDEPEDVDEEDEDAQRQRDAERAAERRRQVIERGRDSGRTTIREREADPPEADEDVLEEEPVEEGDGEYYEDDEYYEEDDEYYEEEEYEDEEYDEEYEDERYQDIQID